MSTVMTVTVEQTQSARSSLKKSIYATDLAKIIMIGLSRRGRQDRIIRFSRTKATGGTLQQVLKVAAMA